MPENCAFIAFKFQSTFTLQPDSTDNNNIDVGFCVRGTAKPLELMECGPEDSPSMVDVPGRGRALRNVS